MGVVSSSASKAGNKRRKENPFPDSRTTYEYMYEILVIGMILESDYNDDDESDLIFCVCGRCCCCKNSLGPRDCYNCEKI